MFELFVGFFFVVFWCIFLEIIATSGRCFDKEYWNEPNWAQNVAEYFRQKKEERDKIQKQKEVK